MKVTIDLPESFVRNLECSRPEAKQLVEGVLDWYDWLLSRDAQCLANSPELTRLIESTYRRHFLRPLATPNPRRSNSNGTCQRI